MGVPARASAAGTSPARLGLVLGALLVPTSLAVGAPAVALPSLARDLDVAFGLTAWVLVAWALSTAVAMPIAGALVDRWGARRTLVRSALLGAVGSLVASSAPALPLLVGGRLLGGLGAGATIIAAYATVGQVLDQDGSRRALATIAGMVAAATGCGTLIGGAVTEWVGWRGTVAVPLLAVLALLPAARLAAVEKHPRGPFDVTGAVLLTMVGGAVVALLQAHSTGLPLSVVVGLALVVVVGAGLLARRSATRPDGFVPRRVVRAPGLVAAGFVGLTLFAGYYAALFAAPALLETNTSWSPLQVGAALLPAALCSVLAARVAGAFGRRRAAWQITSVLAGTTTAGLLLGAALGDTVLIVLALALAICGFAGAQAVLVGLVPRLVRADDEDTAQGLFNFVVYGGASVGPAVVGGLSSVISLTAALGVAAALPVAGGLVSLVWRPQAVPQSGRV